MEKVRDSNLAPIAQEILYKGFRDPKSEELKNDIRYPANFVSATLPENLPATEGEFRTDLSLHLKVLEDIVGMDASTLDSMDLPALRELYVEAQARALAYAIKKIEEHEQRLEEYYDPSVVEIMKNFFIKLKQVLRDAYNASKEVLRTSNSAAA